jgi:hypothetical protein
MKEIYNQQNIENWERSEILGTARIANFLNRESFVNYLKYLENLEECRDLSSIGRLRMQIVKKILYGEPENAIR